MSDGGWAAALAAERARLLGCRTGRWRLGWAFAGTLTAVVLFIALTIVFVVALRDLTAGTALASSLALAVAENTGPLVGNPFSLINFLTIGLFAFAVVGAAAAIQHRRLEDFILLSGTFRWRRFWRMVIAFALIQVVATWLAIGWLSADWEVRPGAFADPLFLAAMVVLIALQSFGEELFFRGYLYHSWGAVLPRPVLAATGCALVFAAVHAWNPDVAIDPMPGLASIFAFALLAQWLVIRTGALDAAWGLHFANNLTAFLVVQVKPGYDSDTSLIQYTDAVWTAGGSYAADPTYWFGLAAGFAALLWLADSPRSPLRLERDA